MGWTGQDPRLAALDAGVRARLDALLPQRLDAGTVLFRAGETARGFVVVLSGRIDVFLMGPNGREILLYTVEPGQSCVQSTLGLLGGEAYSGEAVAATPVEAVLIPRAEFLGLMDGSPAFRRLVFEAFAARIQALMHVLERVAFIGIEARLAAALLDLSQDGQVQATHQDLANRIGSAREVVSRRLEAMTRQGLVATDRGIVVLADPVGLRQLAAALG